MKLKLLDANKAAVYGLPQQDTDTDSIVKDYESRGWKVANIMSHIDAAIDAGVYTQAGDVTVTEAFRNKAGEFVSPKDQDTDGKPERIERKRGTEDKH